MSLVTLREGMVPRFALLAMALALVACGTKLDSAKVSKAVSDGINAQMQMPVASVDCSQAPPDVKAGTTFECTATPTLGGKLTVKVTENDNAGNVSWELTKIDGLLDLQKAEQAVAKGFKEQTGADVTVSCGGRWRAGKTGETFECTAKNADGTETPVTVTEKDADGNIAWSTNAAPTPEGEAAPNHE
jgi:hypothetical protein